VNALWRCGVCENLNSGGVTCAACGADLTRRSAITTTARARLRPAPAWSPPPPAPLPEPVSRAINREPVPDEELLEFEDESSWELLPMPGGCLVLGGRRAW
jgi:hypothetical protein